jgi:transposase-like protein
MGHGYRENKPVVVGAVQRGGDIRLALVPNARRHHLHGFIRENVHGETEAIYTDELASYRSIEDADTIHESVNNRAGEYVRGNVHTNTVESAWSIFKRGIVGSWHQLSVKHLPAYSTRWSGASTTGRTRSSSETPCASCCATIRCP